MCIQLKKFDILSDALAIDRQSSASGTNRVRLAKQAMLTSVVYMISSIIS